MDPWKYVVIWLLPGLVLIGICLQQGEWRRKKLHFALWCPLILALGPFFLIGIAYVRSHE